MEKTLKYVYNSHRLSFLLKLVSHLASLASVAAFIYMFFALWHESFYSVVRLLLVCGAPFIVVSLLRRFIDAPRPYELYDFYILPPKDRRGRSFPSRHAYSAFSIGTCLCYLSPIAGAALLTLAALLCVARVLLGIHFIRDVLAGAVIGATATLLGKFIFSLA